MAFTEPGAELQLIAPAGTYIGTGSRCVLKKLGDDKLLTLYSARVVQRNIPDNYVPTDLQLYGRYSICKKIMDEITEENTRLKSQLISAESDLELLRKDCKLLKECLADKYEETDELQSQLRSHFAAIEELKQEIYVSQNKLETKVKNEEWLNEELTQLKVELEGERKNRKESIDSGIELSSYKRQIIDLQADAEQFESIHEQHQKKIENLELLLKQKIERKESVSKSFLDEENELREENNELIEENTRLKSQLISAESDIELLRKDRKQLKDCLANKYEEIDELQSQSRSYFTTIERTKQELVETKAELDSLKILEVSDHNKKGNSLFAEVEDRRVAAENILVSMKAKYESLKKNYECEKEMRHRLKMQMIPLLEMSKGEADKNHMQFLEEQLARSTSEVKELRMKVIQLEKARLDFPQNGCTETNTGSTECKDSRASENFFKAMIASKDKAIATLTEEKNETNLLYLNEKRKVMDLETKVYSVEKNYEKLNSKNLKLALKNEELLMKYDPDSVTNKNNTHRGKTEKLPIPIKEGDQNSDIVLKEKVKFIEPLERRRKINQPCKVLTDTTSSLNMASLAEDIRQNQLDYNLLCKKLGKKTVSISDNVEIMNDEKEELDNLDIPVLREREATRENEAPKSRRVQCVVRQVKLKKKPITLQELMNKNKEK